MSCYHPLKAYRLLAKKTDKGKCQIIFNIKETSGTPYETIELPCNQCIGCRIDKSREWALRCVHEASLYEKNCFITLTFNEENINETETLVKSDFQKFMKRLRKKYKDTKIRYFHCGEYGDQLSRPHHHAALFNFDFPDKILWTTRENIRLYRSEILEGLWPFGFSTIGDLTYASAAYIARYVTKKINGKQAEEHYRKTDTETGEVIKITPEYITMSRRPGIGKNWIKQYTKDAYPKDFVTVNGKKFKIPKYYDSIYSELDDNELNNIKNRRTKNAKVRLKNNTLHRLRQKEKCQKDRAKRLRREFEL